MFRRRHKARIDPEVCDQIVADNVRLASRLTGWAIDLVTGTPDAYEERFQVQYDGSKNRPKVQQSPAETAAAVLPEGPDGAEAAPAGDSTPTQAAPPE